MMSWLDKLKAGLSKTSVKITTGIDNILHKRKLDKETAEELEDLLISADLGVEASQHLVKELIEKYRFNKEVNEDEIKQTLANSIASILAPLSGKEITFDQKPKIIIMCGVNGGGKTTSIAKLTHYYKQQGKSIMLAACDTFRAAAIDQLETWAAQLNIPIIKGTENSDPASVAYKAAKEASDKKIDLLMIDTAGRLHNKEHLMSELAKIIKVVKKINEAITPEIILVLDATTGQNALIQLEKFQEISPLNGLIITKLDGTSKGGIIVAIALKHNIPILAIGVGESIDDLRPFSAQDFAENLVK
ncbi:MAG: signal recognition particle-docking protein FtsY [Rickettsiales bacterium]|nr:signal recognition particle-docking protein FtsY [Rickettsiales bacterium]